MAELFDDHTGLPGNDLFRDRLEQAAERGKRERSQLALLILSGDARLSDDTEAAQTVAEKLQGCVRATDTVARPAPGIFAVVQTGLKHFDGAAFLAQKLLDSLDVPALAGAAGNGLDVGIGIAVFPEDGEPPALIAKASEAASQAHGSGVGYRFHAAAMTSEARPRVDMGRDLHGAAGRGELRLQYQPSMSLVDRVITGAEALLRWQHPSGGLIPPELFVPIAEEIGLISELGGWALRRACSDLSAWQQAGIPPVRIAVNVAAQQMTEGDIVAVVDAALAESGVDPAWLELEITESGAMDREISVYGTLAAIRRRGIRLTVDDFGTGYSSLAYLKDFPVDRIKIDRSFVRDLTNKHEDAAIVRAVIGLGHSLGMEVVAEGADTAAHIDTLVKVGCDSVQGYHVSPPLDADDFAALLQKGL